jgi:beta-galactosidase
MRKLAIRMAALMLLVAVSLDAFSFSLIRSNKRVNNQTLFDQGWTFALGDHPEAAAPDFDDKTWRKLDLPHDWSIEGTTAANEPAGNDGGYFPTGIGWYRKSFTLDKIDRIRDRFGLYFEGVYMNSEVYVNGHLVGKYPYGYSSFHYDITPYINKEGRNTVAVRVDNSGQKNCRWYSGSGIYRHVWLTSVNSVHIAHQGVFITTPEVSEDKAVVRIATTLKNETDKACQATLKFGYSEAGIELPFILVTQADMNEGVHNLTQTIELPAQSTREVIMEGIIRKEAGTYRLWSPEDPYLYDAILTLTVDNRQMDRVKETFGIRKVEYSAEKGLLLNGKPI